VLDPGTQSVHHAALLALGLVPIIFEASDGLFV
jgi:hypothetical protein